MRLLQTIFVLGFVLLPACSRSSFHGGRSVPEEKQEKSENAGENTRKSVDDYGTPVDQSGANNEENKEGILKNLPGKKPDGSFVFEYRALTKKSEVITPGLNKITLTDLDSLTPLYQESFRQTDRPTGVRSFPFPYNGQMAKESFTKNNLGLSDIILVMDNSHSMKKIQEKVAGKLSSLVSSLGEADWRLKIVTTDASDDCNKYDLIQKSTPDYAQVFSDTLLSVGTNGSLTERGIYAANQALKCLNPGDQTSWIRPHSNIAVIIVSDEDNCTRGVCYGANDSPLNAPESLLTALTENIGGTSRILKYTAKTYGIISLPGTSCQDAFDGIEAKVYHDLISATSSGSMTGDYFAEEEDLCAEDYSSIFRRISQDISDNLLKVFSLKHHPDFYSLRVELNGKELTLGSEYKIEANQLLFTMDLPDISQISIEYSYGSAPLPTEFFIADSPFFLEKVLLVHEDNQEEEPAFSLDGSILRLQEAPLFDTELLIHYRHLEPSLKKSFSLSQILREQESLSVMVNGVREEVILDKAGNAITFDSPPPDDSLIEVSYRTGVEVVGKIRLPEGLDPLAVTAMTMRDRLDGSESPVVIGSGGFLIPDAGHLEKAGEPEIILEVSSYQPGTFYPLKSEPFLGEMLLEIVKGNEEMIPCDSFELVSTPVPGFIASCSFPGVLSFRAWYLSKNQKPVVIDLELDEPDSYEWNVQVNGLPFSSYTRDGAVFTLPSEELGVISVITIHYQKS